MVGSWAYPQKHIATRIVKTILTIDYTLNKWLDKLHMHLPGLSLLAVCRK
jgi:hypothetical protein